MDENIVRIKNNVKKMLDQKAPVDDVDRYLSEEGVTKEDLQKDTYTPPEAPEIKGMAREILATPAHFVNQLLWNNPRELARANLRGETKPNVLQQQIESLQSEFPKHEWETKLDEAATRFMANPEAETPIGQTASRIAGVIGGIASPGKWGTVAKSAAGKLAQAVGMGAAQGIAYAPENDVFNTEKRLQNAVIGGGMAGAVSRVPPVAKFVRKNLAQFSDETANVISRLGFGKIRDVAIKGSDFLTKEIMPEARAKVLEHITKAGKKSARLLEDMGFDPDEIGDIVNISSKRLSALKKNISESWYETRNNLKLASQETGKKIGYLRDLADKKNIRVNIGSAYGVLKRELEKMGVIDLQGNLLGDINLIDPSTKKAYAAFKQMHENGRYLGTVGSQQIKNYADFLNEARKSETGTKTKFNIPLNKVLRSLRVAEAKLLAQAGRGQPINVRKLMRRYHEDKTLEDLGDSLNNIINDNPEQLPATLTKLRNPLYTAQRGRYKNIYGSQLVDKMDAYLAGKEITEKAGPGMINSAYQSLTKAGWQARDVGRGIINNPNVSGVIQRMPGLGVGAMAEDISKGEWINPNPAPKAGASKNKPLDFASAEEYVASKQKEVRSNYKQKYEELAKKVQQRYDELVKNTEKYVYGRGSDAGHDAAMRDERYLALVKEAEKYRNPGYPLVPSKAKLTAEFNKAKSSSNSAESFLKEKPILYHGTDAKIDWLQSDKAINGYDDAEHLSLITKARDLIKDNKGQINNSILLPVAGSLALGFTVKSMYDENKQMEHENKYKTNYDSIINDLVDRNFEGNKGLKRLLKETLWQESKAGTMKNSQDNIMQVDLGFAKDLLDPKYQAQLAYLGAKYKDHKLDLSDPKTNIIAAMMHYFVKTKSGNTNNMYSRAAMWKKYYNTIKGKGTITKYIQNNRNKN